MKRSQGTRGLLVPVVAVLVAALTGCGSGSAGTAASSSGSSSVASSSPVAVLPPPPSDQPFGTGCAAAVPAGAAAAMAREPVVLAASQDPALTPFVVAIQTANLSDSFDSLQNITVLAPVATAVGAIHRATWRTLLADPARMTEVLTHHVIQGRLTPAQLAGTWPTLNNDTVTITGNGAVFTVAAGETMAGAKPAAVVCGNVQTANATIYLIDQVLKPQGF